MDEGKCKNCQELKRLMKLLARREESLKRAREENANLRGQLINLTQKIEY